MYIYISYDTHITINYDISTINMIIIFIYHHWFDISPLVWYLYIYNFITINQHQPTRLLNTAQLPRNAADSRDATVAVAVVATVASVVPGDAGDQRSRALAAAWRFKGIGVDVSGFFPWKNGGFPWKNGGFPWKNGGFMEKWWFSMGS